MAKKKFYINATVVVPDPTTNREAIKDGMGNTLAPARTGKKYVRVGDAVELEEADGNRLLAKHGAFDPNKPPRDLNRIVQTFENDTKPRLDTAPTPAK